MTSDRPGSVELKSLILVPAIVTLAVTLLRLIGELQGWSPRLFAREAGGAGALVGIVWLVPVFGIYFALKMAEAGAPPGAGRVVSHALLALALVVGSVATATRVLKLAQTTQFLVIFAAFIVAGWIAFRAWPALGRTLLAYGLAARVPVMIVMLIAIFANWGTHYDVAPPELAETAPLLKWFYIGFLPQLLLWVPFTMFVGALFGGLTLLVTRRGRREVAA
jgi:hypothetical protein